MAIPSTWISSLYSVGWMQTVPPSGRDEEILISRKAEGKNNGEMMGRMRIFRKEAFGFQCIIGMV